MPKYFDDKPTFTQPVTIPGADSEGHAVADMPVPDGHTLTVTSSNADAITAEQLDADNPKMVTYTIGGPNADNTPSQSTVRVELKDPVGNVVFFDESLVEVTVGVGRTPSGVKLNLPEN